MIEAGHRVLHTRTTDLVQRLQAARRDLALEAASARLDRFDLVIRDDLAHAQKDQAETSVLFEPIARRYQTRSLAVAANQRSRAWNRVFPDPAVAVAAIDRLVHHATILEMNVDSYRRRAAATRKGDDVAVPATASADSLNDNHKGAARAAPTPLAAASKPAIEVARPRLRRLTLYIWATAWSRTRARPRRSGRRAAGVSPTRSRVCSATRSCPCSRPRPGSGP